MERTYRFYFSAWLLGFMAAVATATNRQPPMITKFIQKDLIDPEDVTSSFELPCEATGTNLTWTWRHNDKEITDFNGYPYSVSQDGTLNGNSLTPEQNGTYQCFVKDMTTGIEVFSRKLQVVVTVAGEFNNTKDVVKKVDLGKPFQFQCPPHSAGFGATYSWVGKLESIALSRNERRGISPKGSVYISHVTKKDIDEIEEIQGVVCRVTAANSFYNSGTLKLEKNDPAQSDPNTLFPPYWADVPADEEIAIEGRSKTLYCFAMGRPAPNITWKKNGRQIFHGQNSFQILSAYKGRRLTITNVSKKNHEDLYTCEAENSHNKEQPLLHSINVVVKVPPRWSEGLPPRKVDIIIRRNKTLHCNVRANPKATIMWYKNSQPLQSSADHLIVDGNKLHLRNVNLTDDGVYQCAAENEYGMIVSATWVHVKAWKPSFANGQFGPFALLHGSKGTLLCKPSAQPPPTFQWFRNGVLISDRVNSRYMLQSDGTLVIKKVDKDKDSVNYTCTAQNMLGKESATTVPEIHTLPSFITKPQNRTVTEKKPVSFYCNANGNPVPTITWVKDGKTVGTGNTLRFQTIWRYQSGTYWCLAENGLNVTIKASAELNVKYLPIFTRRPTDQTVKEGEEATFNCIVTGNPLPKVTWLKDGMTVGTGKTLKVVALKNRSGKYWCSADNGLGLAIKASANLIVLCENVLRCSVPLPPTDVNISDCSDWTANLSWVPDPSNDASVTHYLIEQELDGNPVVFRLLYNVTNPNIRSVKLNLTRGTVLRFRVKAVNSVGASRPSSTVETTCESSEAKLDAREDAEGSSILNKAWFLTLLVLVSYALLFSLLAVLYRKYKAKGVKYEVAKRERKRRAPDEPSQNEEDIGEEELNSLVEDTEKNPPEEKQQENRRSRPISTYSMFEVQFREDGSFTEEYGDEGDDDMVQNIQGTFV